MTIKVCLETTTKMIFKYVCFKIFTKVEVC